MLLHILSCKLKQNYRIFDEVEMLLYTSSQSFNLEGVQSYTSSLLRVIHKGRHMGAELSDDHVHREQILFQSTAPDHGGQLH